MKPRNLCASLAGSGKNNVVLGVVSIGDLVRVDYFRARNIPYRNSTVIFSSTYPG